MPHTISTGRGLQKDLPDGPRTLCRIGSEIGVEFGLPWHVLEMRLSRDLSAEANAISPPKPAKARPAVGARVRVLTENEDKEGLYYDDDRVAGQARA